MNGLIDPLGGSIAFQISGRMSTSPPRARIGRTFQGFPIVPWLRVRDNFRLRSRILGSAIDPEAELSSVNAAHLLNRFPSTLSGGERAKCAIALALAGDSSILLMDEPFNGLDHWIRKDIVGHVRTQTKARRLVTVIVTHDVFDSCLIADEILLLGGTPTTVQRSLKRPAQGYSIDQIMTEFDRCPDSSRDCSAI